MESTVAHDTSNEVTPFELRRGSLYLTRFEVAKIIGERAVQITNGIINPYAVLGGAIGSGALNADSGSNNGSMSRVSSSPALPPSQGVSNVSALNLTGSSGSGNTTDSLRYENCTQASLATLPEAILKGKNHNLAQVVDTTVHHRTNIYDTAERCQQGVSLSHDPVMMAKYELIQRRIPMLITRSWPDGWVERVPVSELEFDLAQLELLQ